MVTGEELREARAQLGMMWGHGRHLGVNELARALRLGPNGGANILKMERGTMPVSGPISVAVEAMLTGFRPREITADPPAD
jgi:hypothetical protein